MLDIENPEKFVEQFAKFLADFEITDFKYETKRPVNGTPFLRIVVYVPADDGGRFVVAQNFSDKATNENFWPLVSHLIWEIECAARESGRRPVGKFADIQIAQRNWKIDILRKEIEDIYGVGQESERWWNPTNPNRR